jgi:predicted alpha/beta superfamily hydrolase
VKHRAGTFGLLAVLALPGLVTAQDVAPSTPLTLPGTSVYSLHSAATGTNYRIYVALPESYDADRDARYPVVYVLDASPVAVAFVDGYLHLLVYGKAAREAILVGIAYDSLSAGETSARRATEMTPTPWAPADAALTKEFGSDVHSGGAARFLQAFERDFIPFVDKHYRTSSERELVGYSFGGLFGAYVLFRQPDLFQGYLLGSPTLPWDDGVVLKDETAYAATHKALAARVFLSCGSLDDPRLVADVNALAKTLQGRGYAGLQMTEQVFDGETHGSGVPAAVTTGLRVLLAPPAAKSPRRRPY